MNRTPVWFQTVMPLAASNVFMTFAVLFMNQSLELDFVWTGLRLVAAVHFVFRA